MSKVQVLIFKENQFRLIDSYGRITMLYVPNNSHMNGAGKTPTDKTHTFNVKSVQKNRNKMETKVW